MATQTTNYGLTKPSYNETADIGVINSNMDIIDAKMKEIDNKAGSGGGGGGTSDYLQLSNKPKINGIELVDNITTKDLGIVVPQYTSELENDSGFITNEADPTVPAWAKEPTKPTYTAEEVGALPSNTHIPDPTSVVVDRFVSVGTHIADISVNGEKTELYTPTGGGGTSVTVDSELSTTSENPVQNKVITQALNGKGTYSKPTGGIPKTDLASEVQTSLGKADTALQEHQDISGKADKTEVTALSNSISNAWNSSITYAVGQYCIYNNSLWKCLVQNIGQTPTEGTYWTKLSVANEITSVNNSLGGLSFGTDGDGNYGYYGADGSLIPFKGSKVIAILCRNSSTDPSIAKGTPFNDLEYCTATNSEINAEIKTVTFNKNCKVLLLHTTTTTNAGRVTKVTITLNNEEIFTDSVDGKTINSYKQVEFTAKAGDVLEIKYSSGNKAFIAGQAILLV